ncbi:hypothetical protein CCACVL1_05575, partial [Corchorus capsularis]
PKFDHDFQSSRRHRMEEDLAAFHSRVSGK